MVNTFNSTRNDFYNSNTQPRLDNSATLQTNAELKLKPKSKPAPQHFEDGPPPKRQRIDPPEAKGARHAQDGEHSLSRNGNAGHIDSTALKPSLALKYGFEEPKTDGAQQNAVKHTALRDINIKHLVPKCARPEVRQSGPVATRSTANGTQNEEAFMKGARRERESRVTDSDEETSYHGRSNSAKMTRTLSSSTLEEDSAQAPKSTRPVSQKITPRIAKMSFRLQETSPDVLQYSGQTSVKPLKFASPSRSPPTSRSGKRFPLKKFICAALPVAEAKAYEIEVDEKDETFSIHYQDPEITEDVVAGPIRVSKILKITLPSDDDTNVLIISFSDSVLLGRQCSLDFGDSRKTLTEFFGEVFGIDPTIKQLRRAR